MLKALVLQFPYTLSNDQKRPMGLTVRIIGLARINATIAPANFGYYMRRGNGHLEDLVSDR